MFTKRAYQADKLDNLKKKKTVLISKVQKIKVIYYTGLDFLLSRLWDSKLEKHGQS